MEPIGVYDYKDLGSYVYNFSVTASTSSVGDNSAVLNKFVFVSVLLSVHRNHQAY